MPPVQHHHPAIRTCVFAFGVVLIVLSPVVGLLPGPGGIFVFAAGLALTLQTSKWAKRQFTRFKRRWPRLGGIADFGLRRKSAQRRRARDKARSRIDS
jgi:hypothetical protein